MKFVDDRGDTSSVVQQRAQFFLDFDPSDTTDRVQGEAPQDSFGQVELSGSASPFRLVEQLTALLVGERNQQRGQFGSIREVVDHLPQGRVGFAVTLGVSEEPNHAQPLVQVCRVDRPAKDSEDGFRVQSGRGDPHVPQQRRFPSQRRQPAEPGVDFRQPLDDTDRAFGTAERDDPTAEVVERRHRDPVAEFTEGATAVGFGLPEFQRGSEVADIDRLTDRHATAVDVMASQPIVDPPHRAGPILIPRGGEAFLQ